MLKLFVIFSVIIILLLQIIRLKNKGNNMINKKLFLNLNKTLIDILNDSNLDVNEIEDKKNKLNDWLNEMINTNKLNNYYYSLAHEIKSYKFLEKMGNLVMAKDTRNEKGPDFRLNNYKIECVCCSSGDVDNNGLENYRLNENQKEVVFDYNKLLEILLPRITQALNEKSDKFRKYINDRSYK